MPKAHYEVDNKEFSAPAYTAAGWSRGVAWHLLGWETLPDEDTEWSGIEQRTGRVVACMVGDDRYFIFDKEDLKPIKRADYCGVCGQVGCHADGYEEDQSAERDNSVG